uniref:Uncharacterized protein n=1 Tax=Anguilla anguilla TaxID=7936 RepID=A0A0E9PRH0_ANGAN
MPKMPFQRSLPRRASCKVFVFVILLWTGG